MHLADTTIPLMAAAFQQYLIENGQEEGRRQLTAFNKDIAKLRRGRKTG